MSDNKPEYVSIHDRQREIDAKRKGQEPGKTLQEPNIINVPAEQAWLHHMLNEQTKILKSINGKLHFFYVITIVSMVISVLYAIYILISLSYPSI